MKRDNLYAIPTEQAHLNVRNLQRRLIKAAAARDNKKLKQIMRLMLHSYSSRVVAIEQVTRINEGKKTSGTDGVTILSDRDRVQAANRAYLRVEKKPVKRVYIPKRNGKKRPLGIPTIHERIQQKIFQLIMDPLYSIWGNKNSFGFRPGRCTRDCLEIIWMCTVNTKKTRILIDGDIKGCFDNISHETLYELIKPYTTPIMRQQIWMSLKSGAIEKGVKLSTEAGTPQGGIISPVLANIALDILDKKMDRLINTKYKSAKTPLSGYTRYADDFVAILEDSEHVPIVINIINEALSLLNLQLNMEKVKIVKVEDGLKFLGYHIKKYPTGKVHVGIPNESVKDLNYKIKDIIKGMKSVRQDVLINKLNPIINGWANYYRWTRAGNIYSSLDSYLWKKTWQWSVRRHPRKSRKWIAKRYYHKMGSKKWLFSVKDMSDKVVQLSDFYRKHSEKYPTLSRDKNFYLDTQYFDSLKIRRSWKYR